MLTFFEQLALRCSDNFVARHIQRYKKRNKGTDWKNYCVRYAMARKRCQPVVEPSENTQATHYIVQHVDKNLKFAQSVKKAGLTLNDAIYSNDCAIYPNSWPLAD